MIMKYLKQFVISLLCVTPAMASYGDNANAAITILQNKWYKTDTGLWDGLWWESANMLTAVAKFGSADGSFKQTASDIIANTHAKAPNGGTAGAHDWKNGFYDDMGWWAMAWIASYDLTGNEDYLSTARDLFEEMTGGWTTPCNGGIWWDTKKTQIASIANELFLAVSASLANRVADADKQDYLHWAQMEWDWFSKSGLINGDQVINDGLDVSTCKNNDQKVWTYNQGVILTGLAELARATNNGAYTDSAKTIAKAAMNKLSVDGILTEDVGSLDVQSQQFKGPFVRGLAALQMQAPDQSFKDYLRKNADSAWSKDKGADGVIGPNWSGKDQGTPTSTGHAAGVDLLVAAAAVQ